MRRFQVKRTLFITIILAALILSTGAQTFAAQTNSSPKAQGGMTIVVGLSAAPDTLDPADHRSRIDETVIRNMFDGLVTRDNSNGVHLELAEAMTWSDNGKDLTVNLRHGVLFHDGIEMKAEDVVFTFNRIIQENGIEYPEPHTSPRKGLITPLESIEQLDDYTVVLHFNAVWPIAEQMLVHQQIVPKHYLEAVGTEGFLAHPIGTGPFKFVSAQLDSEVVLERFDDYYGGAPDLGQVGPAPADRVIFRVIPETSTRVAALLAGEVQIIQDVPADLVPALEADSGVVVKTAAGTNPMWLQLTVTNPLFQDKGVRQAMNYAIDKDLINEAVYGGRSVSLPGPLSPYNSYVDPNLSPYPYDPDKALALLADAGWTDSNGDGVLDKDGQDFSFTIDTLQSWTPLAEALSSMYREIGIDASIRYWEYSVLKDELLACSRQAFLDDWGDSAFDPVGHWEAKWHTYSEGTPYGRGNFMCYSNARVDELTKAGEVEPNGPSRHAIYNEAQEIVYDEAPAVFLILPEVIEACSARIQNWEPASDGRVNLHDVSLSE
jgi:peptide/nickel transport system substrate-binding protein